MLISDCSTHYPLCLLCSALIVRTRSTWLGLVWISSLISDLSFAPLDPIIFLKNNLQLGYTSPSSSVYYNTEAINNINIDFIVIIVTRMQSPTRNAAGILVLCSDPDSHFFPGCAEQA